MRRDGHGHFRLRPLGNEGSGSSCGIRRVRLESEQLKALATRRTLNGMRPAIAKEESSLLTSEIARALAVNVNDVRAVGLDDIIDRELA